MDKASKAIRRSGVRLRTISSRHAELEMLISELRTVRAAQRGLVSAQERASQDLLRWAQRDENRAVQQTAQLLAELTEVYGAVQTEFNAQLKALRYQFEMILEGEEQLDNSRSHLATCQTKEAKHRRDLKKSTAADMQQAELKLTVSERNRTAAQQEVTERTRENEVVKVTRLKQGLLTLSDAYLQLAHKTQLVFEAHRDIVSELPDLDAAQLHNARYTGAERCRQRVDRVRELVQAEPSSAWKASPPSEPPPPYASDTPDRRRSSASCGGPPLHCHTCGAARSYGWRDASLGSAGDYSPSAPVDSPDRHPPGAAAPPGRSSDRKFDLTGAVGGLQLR